VKIILSRKGFDSAAGGVPSPILPDGSLVSLPIPDKASKIAYQDIAAHGHASIEWLLAMLRKAHRPPEGNGAAAP